MAKARSDAYRPIYCRLVDDVDFQALTPNAKLVWFTLRTCPECGPIGIFRLYVGQLSERTGLNMGAIEASLAELEDGQYITRERGHVYLRNALRYEPLYDPRTDPKHRANMYANLEPLRSLGITLDLLRDNELPIPEGWEAARRPIEGASKGHRRPIEGACKALATPDPDPEPDPEPEPEPDPDEECAELSADGLSAPDPGDLPEAVVEVVDMVALAGFPCVGSGPKSWDLTASHAAQLHESFPALDIAAEARKARQWLRDNPERRKTARGMPRSLGGWMTRAQESGSGVRSRSPRGSPAMEAIASYARKNADDPSIRELFRPGGP